MTNIKLNLKNLFLLVAIMAVFTACDKDFVSLDSDISGENNFGVSDNTYEVIAYNNKLNPVQTNGLPANLFGFYKDLTYGSTTANVVTQLSPAVFDPVFPKDVRLDSVVLTIPYFSKPTGIEKEETMYKLDSIYGSDPISFKIYENSYFLRSFDPTATFDTPQKYYSDRSLSATSEIPLTSLQSLVLKDTTDFKVRNKEIILKKGEELKRIAPAMRFKMKTDFWNKKIILKSGKPELSNINNFQNYFRGLYFEVAADTNEGSMMLLNFGASAANITLFYSSPATGTGTERIEGSYKLNFSGNRANFFDNDFTTAISQGNPTTGDEKLYLKGGEGSVALIDLFEGTDIDSDEGTMTTFEEFKNAYVETDAAGKFVKAKRLVNEANLVFYVDQSLTRGQEPDRVYIYDTKNGTPLLDYSFDSPDVDANISISNHLGALKRSGDDGKGKGVKYKIKITEHIKNLLMKDSTNVTLGLAVSTNVTSEVTKTQGGGSVPLKQKTVQSAGVNAAKSVPVSAILSPKGTVLYGNNTSDQDKKLYLEIFYTEPNN